jgi:hypothetical protein
MAGHADVPWFITGTTNTFFALLAGFQISLLKIKRELLFGSSLSFTPRLAFEQNSQAFAFSISCTSTYKLKFIV